jgi:hypothetical protein
VRAEDGLGHAVAAIERAMLAARRTSEKTATRLEGASAGA